MPLSNSGRALLLIPKKASRTANSTRCAGMASTRVVMAGSRSIKSSLLLCQSQSVFCSGWPPKPIASSRVATPMRTKRKKWSRLLLLPSVDVFLFILQVQVQVQVTLPRKTHLPKTRTRPFSKMTNRGNVSLANGRSLV
jgi:hypothetical protein